jgi:hypothetical protein
MFCTPSDPILNHLSAMNQRGGRLLSLVDLIDAGTLSPALAARLVFLQMRGVSIASCAKTGGMGKTTLLAAVLAFTPRGVDIVTVDRAASPPFALIPSAGKRVWLCHEISRGDYYSYLWGKEIAAYFSLADGPHNHLAFTIHADDPGEIEAQIASPETGLSRHDLLKLDTLAFINGVDTPLGRARRVTGLYEKKTGGRHVPTFLWRKNGDVFERFSEPHNLEEKISGFFQTLIEGKVRALEEVRNSFLLAASSFSEGPNRQEHKKPSRRWGEGFLW